MVIWTVVRVAIWLRSSFSRAEKLPVLWRCQRGGASIWGWGYEDQQPALEEVERGRRRRPRAPRLRARRGGGARAARGRRAAAAAARAARVARRDLLERALRARLARLRQAPTATSCAPSAVASTTRPTSWPTRATRPSSRRLLDWCADAGAAAIPYGGGTSVVGGVEPARRRRLRGRGDDRPGRARPRARGRPRLARGAHPGRRARARRSRTSCASHGLTLRHFPQSFEFSTLGGWIATRAGGHFATLYTHIDDLVESVRALTPRGVWESRRLPGLGRGAEPRPAAARLRGHPRRDHRGLGARPGAADASARRPACTSTASSRAPRRCARSRSPASTRRTAACSTRARPRITGRRARGQGAARARLRVGRPPARRRGWSARSSCCGDHGGERAERRRTGARAGERGAAWTPGATRSSRRPTCATR